jgi:hypothetical protein
MPRSTRHTAPPFSKGRVFRVVVLMMGVAIAAIVALSIWGTESDMHRQAFALCVSSISAGFGSLLTLISTQGRS